MSPDARPLPRGARPRARGVSLIEVLVSLVVLSLGILSVVALQMVSKRNNADAGQRTIAAQLAYDIIERMRANSSPTALAAYVNNGSPFPTIYLGRGKFGDEPTPKCDSAVNNTSPNPCTGTQLALHDLWAWEQALDGAAELAGTSKTGGLLFPTGCVTGPAGGGSGLYQVTIAWRGTIELPDRNTNADASDDVACGAQAVDGSGARIYGSNDEFRRTLSLEVFITSRAVGGP